MHITTSPDDDDTLPCYASSVEGLQFIGFTKSAATKIYKRWTDRGAGNPDSLWTYAMVGQVSTINIPELKDKTDRQRMTAIGLRQDIQDAILEPRFERVRRTKYLQFWIRDTLEINYRALCLRVPEDEETEAEEAAERALKAFEEVQGASDEGSRGEGSQSSIVRPTLTLERRQSASSLPPFFVQRCALRPDPPPVLPGHMVLYKACAIPELFQNYEYVLDEDGTVHLFALSDWDGTGDFHSWTPATYWLADEGIADLYRVYIAVRCRRAATCVVRILVPYNYLASVKVESLLHDEKRWKDHVGFRKGMRPRRGFEESKDVDVVVGHICTVGYDPFRCEWEDAQTALGAGNVLRLDDGRKAVQWCFKYGRDDVRLLEHAVHGKVHFDVFEQEDRVEESGPEEMGEYWMRMSWA